LDLTKIETVKKLLISQELWAKKFLGQNFLISKPALEKIVEAAGITGKDHIIEVGPGLGVLTRELCQKAKSITSIEIDSKLLPILKQTLADFNNVEVLNQDALQYEPQEKDYKIVANIPYYITSPLITHFLQRENKPSSITLLIQKEVAEKITKLNPKMSFLSLQTNLFADAELIATIEPNCFHPEPKVHSSIIHLKINPKTIGQNCQNIIALAKRAFSQGRKKLSNTLPELKEKLESLDLDAKRPQHLSIEDWINLAA
jgi:16S rRNA (adenine1518-N6/adenine1519-N6)-dimethyltransferase